MKTRYGFVSNSSSASFVIAVKKDINICPHCNRSDPNIIDLIENYKHDYDGDNTHVNATTWHRIIEYKQDHNWAYAIDKKYAEEQKKEFLAKLDPYMSDKWTIASIDISYHDEITNKILENGIKSGNIVIIEKNE
jgi:hypothetical protein